MSAEDAQALLSTTAQAVGVGRLEWTVEKPRCHRGSLTVATEIMACRHGSLQLYIIESAPSEFSLQYFTGRTTGTRVPVRRLDVNGDHRKWINTTHKHRLDAGSGQESAYIPDDIPDTPLGPTVEIGTYRRVFEAFARECHVRLPNEYWEEPW